MVTLSDLHAEFRKKYKGNSPSHSFFSPGRINLIGEHTDYNGGHVFPASISYGTYVVAKKRNDQKVRFYSMNFPENGIIEKYLSNLAYEEEDDWANYPKGMIQYIINKGYAIDHGIDILYYGNIPNAAGLSSSASIELATGVALERIFDLELDRVEMVKIGQQVENEYIGVNSGIMDQFAIGMGKENHAILLNCDTLDYQYAPLELNNYRIIIINTNKRRELAASKYNERRSECEAALKDLQKELDIKSLGQLSKEEYDKHQHLIRDETHRKRAKHAVYENTRTLEALEALSNNNLEAFGKLMNESHESLQYDYEVTGAELDAIVHAAWEQPGVLGARMTGAGFGGCAIAIVEKDKIDQFKNKVNNAYSDKVGYDATFYIATIGDGAKELEGRKVR
ncbi:galactokinase [Oceanobacillus alkalisoli]|uniref:galactokinase n=1 Tax=Oceanobacillus alkalisoli TaxID=2925113 RepID=UPI001EE428A4|nr:galactokinase [Oceanobacillus alkalisoli]MCG5102392.1 galactokinase [Oceanobacillus alkalisoli]